MAFFNRRNQKRRRVPGDPQFDYDYIVNDGGETRYVKEYGAEGTYSPSAPIDEPDGETIVVGNLEDIKPFAVECTTHDLVEDPTETEFRSLKCTKCPFGVLQPRKQL